MRVFMTILLLALSLAGCARQQEEGPNWSLLKTGAAAAPVVPTAAEVAKVCKRHGVTLTQLPMEGQPGWALSATLVQARVGVMMRPQDSLPCTLLQG
ncbi:MAG: hypothetical protein WAX89_02965, partial [Alphaproteobacteria bacterium]